MDSVSPALNLLCASSASRSLADESTRWSAGILVGGLPWWAVALSTVLLGPVSLRYFDRGFWHPATSRACVRPRGGDRRWSWRSWAGGFATPLLRRRAGVLATGLMLGIIWAAWHLLAAWWGSGTSGAVHDEQLPARPVPGSAGSVWVYEHRESAGGDAHAWKPHRHVAHDGARRGSPAGLRSGGRVWVAPRSSGPQLDHHRPRPPAGLLVCSPGLHRRSPRVWAARAGGGRRARAPCSDWCCC